MANGLVGTTTVEANNTNGLQSGTTVSYTAPGTVRYAVVTVAASAELTSGSSTGGSFAAVGVLKVKHPVSISANGAVDSQYLTYTVILGPGQSYSIQATAQSSTSSNTVATATGTMSALEVF